MSKEKSAERESAVSRVATRIVEGAKGKIPDEPREPTTQPHNAQTLEDRAEAIRTTAGILCSGRDGLEIQRSLRDDGWF